MTGRSDRATSSAGRLGRETAVLAGKATGSVLGVVGAIGAIVVWVYQCYGWLRQGFVPPMPLSEFVPVFSLDGWEGVNKTIRTVYNWNAGFVGLLGGVLGGFIATVAYDTESRMDESDWQAKRRAMGYDT